MSPRLVYIAAALAVVGVAAVIYGFHYRIERKERMKAQAATSIAAGDAATSNRMMLHAPGATQAASLGGTVEPPKPTAVETGVSALKGAVRDVAQPFGSPQAPIQVPGYAAPPTPPIDPVKRMKAEREQRAYEQRLAAMEAPTKVGQGAAMPPPPQMARATGATDPLQSELAHLAETGGVQGPQMGPSGLRMPGMPVTADPNEQDAKRAFQKTTEGDYLKTTRMPPISPWVVERGEVIPAGLPNQIVSDLPGDLVAEVKRDIYDTPQHRFVMIPAGSLLAGEYNSGVTYGQKRVQVIWTYLRFPDGSYVNLDKFVGHSADGSTGLGDQVDNHLKRLIGDIALASAFAAGIQISTGHTNGNVLQPSNTELAASAAGEQAAQVGQQLTNRNLNVQPTIKIRPGDVFYVSVMKSIVFPGPYRALDMGGRK
jgi:type IV secretion system protein VirB10